MNVEDLKPGVIISGPNWPEPIDVKVVEKIGPHIRLVASTVVSNQFVENRLRLDQIADLNINTITTDFSAEPWKVFLSLESKRYRYASLYDPLLAMNTSKVDPLPHQIDAVYGHVLKMPKIRYLLAHDPGAGKTIMAGLIIKELKMRKIINRILIVVPGHLKDQWSREMKDRFLETFTVISKSYVRSQYGENVWNKENQIITSIDFAKREETVSSLDAVEFDLIVVDEAHKMSATRYGEKTEKTERYRLGEKLSRNSEHMLFLTATPHKGDPENFRLFLDLLNPGFFKNAKMIVESLKSNDNPLFLRVIKEDMKDFEGNPLFVPREVKTPSVELSDPEKMLYNDVSTYVREEFDKATKADKQRHIGFALVILQRRMASSTHALFESLKRRKDKLENMLMNFDNRQRQKLDYDVNFDEVEDMTEEERWQKEEHWATLSLAENRSELEHEITTLGSLMSRARDIVNSENESKLTQLKKTLVELGRSGSQDKILIFTESKDTLLYLEKKIREWGYYVNTIHGNMALEDRVNAENVFRNETQIMVATEAAGEGINLQFCHLMINYDLPWNPNRLEQRMGRIHRYGQQKPVTVFNLVAAGTREGEIMKKLFDKLEEIKKIMKSDKVFDVISEILPESLQTLLMDAVTNTRSQSDIIKGLDIRVDQEYIRGIKEKLGDSLATQFIDYTGIRDMRDRAEENKLIPKYVEEMFKKSLLHAGGKCHQRKDGFISIDSIPSEIKRIARDDQFKKKFAAMQNSYPKVTFDRRVAFKNPDSEFITFGHPLFEAMLDWIDKKFFNDVQKGAVFFDPDGRNGYIVFYEGEIKDGTSRVAGKKMFAYFVSLDGSIVPTDPAIIWDLKESDTLSPEQIDIEGIKKSVSSCVMELLEEYKEKIQKERNRQTQIKQKYGIESLSQSIREADNELGDFQNRMDQGDDVRVAMSNKKDKLETYKENMRNLADSIEKEKHLTMSSPSFFGIIRVKPLSVSGGSDMHNDPEIETRGMEVVMQYERDQGRNPEDVSKKNLGFDIRSSVTDNEKRVVRHIEVKARAKEGQISMSRNEWYQAIQLADSYYLYVVWNAADHGVKPLIFHNPAKNLASTKEVIRYLISKEEIQRQQ